MSSTDGPGADPKGSGQTSDAAGEEVQTQLVEALMLLLIEKGVLTRNDALSVIQTVAQVQQGKALESTDFSPRALATIPMLRRMYGSFEALADGSGVALGGSHNVRQLRPPIHGDLPEFPRDD